MSFREIAVTIRAVNRASSEFSRIQTDVKEMAGHIITAFGASVMAVSAFGESLGFLNSQ